MPDLMRMPAGRLFSFLIVLMWGSLGAIENGNAADAWGGSLGLTSDYLVPGLHLTLSIGELSGSIALGKLTNPAARA